MSGKTTGRGGRGERKGSSTRSRSRTKRKNHEEIEANKVKKSMEGSVASTLIEKLRVSKGEEESENKGTSPVKDTEREKSKSPLNTSTDEILTTDSDDDNNGLKDKDSTLLTEETSKSPTAGLKTTGLETQEKSENDGYESDATDTTSKRGSKYRTRISVNFFVPPSENEADQKLYIVAKNGW